MPTREEMKRLAVDLTKKLANDGLLIEAGWTMMRAAVIRPDAPPIQLAEMRLAYMAGAQHLFSSLMAMMDPDILAAYGDVRKAQPA